MKIPNIFRNKKIVSLLVVILIIGFVILIASTLFRGSIFEGLDNNNTLTILDASYCSTQAPAGKKPKCVPPGNINDLISALNYNIKDNSLKINVNPGTSYKNGGLGKATSDGTGPGIFDPAVGKTKQLIVTYKYGANGAQKTASAYDFADLIINN